MSNALDDLEATLLEGLRLSGQGSYARRAPAAPAVPHLSRARAGLRQFVNTHADDARAHRLLSLAEEAFLSYGAARAALARAMELSGGGDERDHKRLAMLREAGDEWAALAITPDELKELGAFLEAKLDRGETDRSLRWTEAWLRDHGRDDAALAQIRAALDDRGAFSDLQVYENVTRG